MASNSTFAPPPTLPPEPPTAEIESAFTAPIVRAAADAPPPAPARETKPAAEAPARPARLAVARRAVPDEIEGSTLPANLADPLAEAIVSASLRWADGNGTPFVLLESRTETQPARARIGYGSAPAALPPSWLEVGDAPAPGWQIVRIDARSIDVLTPYGNPVRLRASRVGSPPFNANPGTLPRQ